MVESLEKGTGNFKEQVIDLSLFLDAKWIWSKDLYPLEI